MSEISFGGIVISLMFSMAIQRVRWIPSIDSTLMEQNQHNVFEEVEKRNNLGNCPYTNKL